MNVICDKHELCGDNTCVHSSIHNDTMFTYCCHGYCSILKDNTTCVCARKLKLKKINELKKLK